MSVFFSPINVHQNVQIQDLKGSPILNFAQPCLRFTSTHVAGTFYAIAHKICLPLSSKSTSEMNFLFG